MATAEIQAVHESGGCVNCARLGLMALTNSSEQPAEHERFYGLGMDALFTICTRTWKTPSAVYAVFGGGPSKHFECVVRATPPHPDRSAKYAYVVWLNSGGANNNNNNNNNKNMNNNSNIGNSNSNNTSFRTSTVRCPKAARRGQDLCLAHAFCVSPERRRKSWDLLCNPHG